MKKNAICYFCLLTVTLLFVSANVLADEYAYGYSTITVDPTNGVVRGYSATEVDYNTQVYYTPYVCGSLYRDGVEKVRACRPGTFRASVNTQIPYSSNDEYYDLVSDHYADIYYYDEYETYNNYYDYYGYSLLPASSYPDNGYFFAPGIYVSRGDSSVRLGDTSVSVPAQKPTILSVIATAIIADGDPGGCDSSNPYGIILDITYQVLDQSSQPINRNTMKPQEKVLNWVLSGAPQGNPFPNWKNIGPTNVSGTSLNTDSTGKFKDAPLGTCGFPSFEDSKNQQISILYRGKRFVVRNQTWNVSSTARNHGSITNNSDIQQSR